MIENAGQKTLAALLKACAKQKDLHTGTKIHANIVRLRLLDKDLYAGSALVNMYAKCGSLSKAEEALKSLPLRNVVSWNALMTGYAQYGLSDEALECFYEMQMDGATPNAVTFICILKACAIGRAAHNIQEIHEKIGQVGLLETHVVVGTALVDAYVKCGLLAKGQEIFDKLPVRNIASWNALITGYVQHGHDVEALNCFNQMRIDGFPPDPITYSCILKACGSLRATDKGEEISSQIAKEGLLERHAGIGTVLVDMYAKFGWLSKAREVFDKVPCRSVVLWSALIAGYTQNGHGKEAVIAFEKMQAEGIHPNAVTLVSVLKACGSIGATEKGQAIHTDIKRDAMLEKDAFLGTAIVDMYAKCALLKKAQEVFDDLPVRDIVAWNALIAGYVQHGHAKEALSFFECMQYEDTCMDTGTFVSVLKACGMTSAIEKGEVIHGAIVKTGLLEKNVLVGTALLDMYIKCGLIAKAYDIFVKLSVRNVVSWNALMIGYIQYGHFEEALNCFDQMQGEGLPPDDVTLTCILKVCGTLGALDKAQELHNEILQKGWLEKHIVVGNALIDMYGKCGLLSKAQEVFDQLPAPDAISWCGLISGYVQYGHNEQALECFEQMQANDTFLDAVTVACIFKACANLVAAEKGQEIHAASLSAGLVEDIFVGSALVDMYAKCGMLSKAQEVFDNLPLRSVAIWNALVTGYALICEVENVFCILEKMKESCVKPNSVTFLSLFNACSHAGLLEVGERYFHSMSTSFGVIPTLEHQTCMIDLCSRAGQMYKALAFIRQMPFAANPLVWHVLLGASQKWSNVELGRLAFEHAMQLDRKDAGAYICMGIIFSDACSYDESQQCIG